MIENIIQKIKKNGSRLQNDEDTKAKINDLIEEYGAPVPESHESSSTFWKAMSDSGNKYKKMLSELARCNLALPPMSVDVERLFSPAANIATDEQTFSPCFLCIVKSPVQISGAGVRLILRSMSGSVQLKNLGLKSLTNKDGLFATFNLCAKCPPSNFAIWR